MTERWEHINTSISDAEVIEMGNDVEMIKRDHLWSFGGKALPLEKRDGSTGMILIARDEPPFRVRLGNLFSVALGGVTYSALPYIDYDSAEAIVADGWEVD